MLPAHLFKTGSKDFHEFVSIFFFSIGCFKTKFYRPKKNPPFYPLFPARGRGGGGGPVAETVFPCYSQFEKFLPRGEHSTIHGVFFRGQKKYSLILFPHPIQRLSSFWGHYLRGGGRGKFPTSRGPKFARFKILYNPTPKKTRGILK